jgi:NAD+ kinase
MVLSVGGDGTFLSAAKRVAPIGIPILGVNLGRIGFLSENSPETVAQAILSGEYSVEDRSMLYSSIHGGDIVLNEGFWPYALNEVTVHRIGSSVLGIHVTLDGTPLPTYWADGLLVATSSGSTAYSLSVGGPICMPESKVLIIAPIAPHNLNVRPLIVPDSSRVSISVETRDPKVVMSMDNRNLDMSPSWSLEVSMAQFSLKRIRLAKSNFVKALTSKLFWGEDIRNNG